MRASRHLLPSAHPSTDALQGPPGPGRKPPLRHGVAFGLMLLSAAPALAEVPKVVTDIPPVAALVAQVMGDLGTPALLLDKGGDEHDLQLRPSQMRDLSQAGLLVWVGPDLTPGLNDAFTTLPDLPNLALLGARDTRRLDYAGGGLNPHAWLDPANAGLWAGLIGDKLAEIDPEHAQTYHDNAKAAQARIATLDTTLADRLKALKVPFVTYHDAYGYFAGHYNLPYLGGLAAGDAAPPGAARLSDLHAMANSGQIACAFPEAQHDSALIDGLAAGTKVFIGPGLDPVGSTLDPGPDAWNLLVTHLADGLLSCAAAVGP